MRAMSPRRSPKRGSRPAARSRPPPRAHRRSGSVPATAPKRRRTIALAEPPHGHIVCRSCGRIHPLELVPVDRELLIDMTARGPEGWAIERVAYSIAAVCPTCRRAAPAV